MNVHLSPFETRHLESTFQWIQNQQLRKMMNMPIATWEQHEAWYRRQKKLENHLFAITVDDEHIGNCCLKNVDMPSRKAELWIYVGNSASRGKGAGKKAMQLLLNYGFTKLGLNRIYLYVMPYNTVAIQMYESLGFCHEGIARENACFENEYYDTVNMGILKKEWSKCRK